VPVRARRLQCRSEGVERPQSYAAVRKRTAWFGSPTGSLAQSGQPGADGCANAERVGSVPRGATSLSRSGLILFVRSPATRGSRFGCGTPAIAPADHQQFVALGCLLVIPSWAGTRHGRQIGSKGP
jgi:hypothetical protein